MCIRIMNSGLKFILFLFSFLFSYQFILYFEELGLGISVMLHVTVTNGHMTRPQCYPSVTQIT